MAVVTCNKVIPKLNIDSEVPNPHSPHCANKTEIHVVLIITTQICCSN